MNGKPVNWKRELRAVVALGGFVALVGGLWMIAVPVALIVGGTILCGLGVWAIQKAGG